MDFLHTVCFTDSQRYTAFGMWWHTVTHGRGSVANGVGSQYSHTASGRSVSSITNADAHTSAASSRLNRPPADLNGLVRLGERQNLVSARVPSGSARAPTGNKGGVQAA